MRGQRSESEPISSTCRCPAAGGRRTIELTQEHDFPKREATSYYSHKLNELVRYAGLEKDRQADSLLNAALAINWNIVIVWNEGSRYERITAAKAQELYDAIAEATHGVLPWLKKRW